MRCPTRCLPALLGFLLGQDGRVETYESMLVAALEHGLPGIVVLVDAPGHELWIGALGYADLETEEELEPGSVLHLGSVSKLFTAVAALRLVDAGELELSTSVVDVLPEELTAGLPHVEEITLSQLLDHTSGLYSFNNEEAYWETLIGAQEPGRIWSFEELLGFAKASGNEPLGLPGEGAHYSDTNYVLLALIIERVSGQEFKEHVKQTLFEPLEMSSTSFLSEHFPDRAPGPRPVEGYDVLSEELPEERYHPIFPRLEDLHGAAVIQSTAARERNDAAAGVVSSARDLYRFARALFDGELLDPDSMDWLLAVGAGMEDAPLGEDRQAVFRGIRSPAGTLLAMHGDGPGTNALLALHPESGALVIALSNGFGLWTTHEFLRREVVAAAVALE